MRDPALDLSRVRGMSLERKLPLLMGGVLLVILGAATLLTYREVRGAAEAVTVSRLRDVAEGLAASTAASVPRQAALFTEVAREPAVQRALGGTPSNSDLAIARAALRKLSTPTDSGIVTQLKRADGRVIVEQGDMAGQDARPATAGIVTGPDSLAVGAFYESGGRVYYWNSRPVYRDGLLLGTIAQRRRLNSQPATEREIARLTGQEAHLVFQNADGSLWTTVSGRPVDPPSAPQMLRGMRTYAHDQVSSAGRVLIAERNVERTPWIVALELPVASLRAGPEKLMRRFALISGMLLLVGAALIWLVSRRITQPLKRLTAAAEGIARGDYSQRVKPRGDYEIARLGVSFNRMASEIAATNNKLHEAADAAARAREAAEAANTSKSNFLAAMSHELRTPLNAIAGYVELLELGLRGPLTNEQREDLARIKRSQRYLLGLIEEVLVFSQLDAQQLTFDIRDVSIDAIIRDAEAMVEPQIRAKGVRYSYDSCDPALLVHADRDKTQQVIINLLVNATKYTDPGGSITVSCDTQGERVQVKVSDTGVGIPAEKLGRIFDAFVQLGRSLNKPREGVGLGLTISRDLSRAMGGDLNVESELGIGSTFTLELPKARQMPVVAIDSGRKAAAAAAG